MIENVIFFTIFLWQKAREMHAQKGELSLIIVWTQKINPARCTWQKNEVSIQRRELWHRKQAHLLDKQLLDQ